MNAGIIGMGRCLPEKILTNYDLEKMVDTNDEWIRTRTGIEERRIAGDDMDTSDMAYEAAVKALEDANITAEEIGMILVATVTPDHPFPSVACMLQERLGAKNAAAMDVSAACAGFMYGMITAKQFIESDAYKYMLVVGVEKLSKITDWNDRNTAVLFGDGAGAVVMGRVSEGRGILSFELGADGTGGKHLYQDEYIIMNGREVFKFAVRQMAESSVNVIEKAGLTKEDVDFLFHTKQIFASWKHHDNGWNYQKKKCLRRLQKYGNTSSSSIPIAIVEELEAGKIKDDDLIVMVGFGGGLTWGAIAIRWGVNR